MSNIIDSPTYARVLDTRLEAVSENRICYALKEGSALTAFVPLVSSSHSKPKYNFQLKQHRRFYSS